jgi:hypothetical protein
MVGFFHVIRGALNDWRCFSHCWASGVGTLTSLIPGGVCQVTAQGIRPYGVSKAHISLSVVVRSNIENMPSVNWRIYGTENTDKKANRM